MFHVLYRQTGGYLEVYSSLATKKLGSLVESEVAESSYFHSILLLFLDPAGGFNSAGPIF